MRFETAALLCASSLLSACPGGVLTLDTGIDDEAYCHGELAVSLHDRIATVLVVEWSQRVPSEATAVEFRFDGGDWQSSPPAALPIGPASEVVLGVPQDTEVEVRLANHPTGATCDDRPGVTARTGLLPGRLPEPTVIEWDPALASPEGYLLYSMDVNARNYYDGPYYTVIVDRAGHIVWYRPSGWGRTTMYPRVGKNGGYILLDESTAYTWTGESGDLFRLTLDLAHEDSMPIPGFAYSFDELPDGTILRDQIDYLQWEYRIVEQAFGEPEDLVWRCNRWQPGLSSSCYSNTVNWVQSTDTILWSMVMLNTVLEIDRTTGEVVHQWGDYDGSSAISPPEAGFDFQHYPSYTPDGTLLVSVHGHGDHGPEQRAREYAITESGQLEQVWSYGQGVDEYAMYSGEAYRLTNGNTLIGYGTGGALREVTADGQVAWDLDWGQPLLVGHATLVEDLYALNTGPAGR